jgi:NADH-quinone oxidoreductase subunit N
LVGIAGASKIGMTSAIYFIIIYLLSNVASFGVIGAISESFGKETLEHYKGLYKSNPFYALIFAISLFSLAGIPPTAGFFGKLFLLTSGIGSGLYLLLAVAAINLVLSLYNYLRVVKIMFIDETNDPLPLISKNFALTLTLVVCISGILLIGFYKPVYEFIYILGFGMK